MWAQVGFGERVSLWESWTVEGGEEAISFRSGLLLTVTGALLLATR